jgi:hypothetical protein
MPFKVKGARSVTDEFNISNVFLDYSGRNYIFMYVLNPTNVSACASLVAGGANEISAAMRSIRSL